MEPYCKVLPICYTLIQTYCEFSVGQMSCGRQKMFNVGKTLEIMFLNVNLLILCINYYKSGQPLKNGLLS